MFHAHSIIKLTNVLNTISCCFFCIEQQIFISYIHIVIFTMVIDFFFFFLFCKLLGSHLCYSTHVSFTNFSLCCRCRLRELYSQFTSYLPTFEHRMTDEKHFLVVVFISNKHEQTITIPTELIICGVFDAIHMVKIK